MMDKWDKRFMEMANVVSTWSSCYRTGRQVGAVITKTKESSQPATTARPKASEVASKRANV